VRPHRGGPVVIITLCGSARFEGWFHAWNEALTVAGHTVFSLACLPSIKGTREWYDAETKEALDFAHRRKIEASKAIVVLNAFGYIGPSTLREIEHAKEHKKRIHFLQSWGQGQGVGPDHFPELRQYAARYFSEGFPTSPIDTFGFPSAWTLLGPAGSFERTAALRAAPEAFR
jgi:hypothetical protein